jgi:hypothetical protein
MTALTTASVQNVFPVTTLALSGYRMQPADSSVIRSYDVVGRDTIRVLNMPEEKERIYRFIVAFEERYGRKPKVEDAEGDFKLQVARDMQMSVGGARYYLRLAAEQDNKET